MTHYQVTLKCVHQACQQPSEKEPKILLNKERKAAP